MPTSITHALDLLEAAIHARLMYLHAYLEEWRGRHDKARALREYAQDGPYCDGLYHPDIAPSSLITRIPDLHAAWSTGRDRCACRQHTVDERARRRAGRVDALIRSEQWCLFGLPTPTHCRVMLLAVGSVRVRTSLLYYCHEQQVLGVLTPHGERIALGTGLDPDRVAEFLADMAHRTPPLQHSREHWILEVGDEFH